MTEYDNRNNGALFKNERKTKPSQPDYTGNYTDKDGNEYWLSAWIKKSRAGQTYMSLATTIKEDQVPAYSGPDPDGPKTEIDDDIPF